MEKEKTLTEAEIILYKWQYGILGGFYTSLMQTMMRDDTLNSERLSLAYPSLMKAVNRFRNEEGYWEYIETKMKQSLKEKQ